MLRYLLAVFQPKPRNVLAWVLAIGLAITYLLNAWLLDAWFSCDFASQWLMGRMVVKGQGRELYRVSVQREVLAQGYQGEQLEEMDSQILQKGAEGSPKTGIEGPLYPPTMGLLMAAFAVLEPKAAFAALAVISLQLCFLSAWLLKDITRGRLRMGEAAALVLLFPHVAMTVTLGQNAPWTLAILTAGWAVRARGWPLLAGVIWGLLAYKPVFAVALIWVPLVLGPFRMFLGMLAGGVLFCLATLPVCGFDLFNANHSWSRWLVVGENAAIIYSYDPNWVWMSRDLISLPRRDMWSLDYTREHVLAMFGLKTWSFDEMQAVDTSSLASWIGRGLLAGVIGLTVIGGLIARWRQQMASDPSKNQESFLSAFVLLGALLSTYHFIWYDLLPMALPCLLLVVEARRMSWFGRGWLIILALVFAVAELNLTYGTGPVDWPVETFVLLLTWGWAGWRAVAR